MKDKLPFAAVGANVGLEGLRTAITTFGGFLNSMNQLLSVVLLVVQLVIGGLTAWYLWMKVREARANARAAEEPKKKRKSAKRRHIALLIAAIVYFVFLAGCGTRSHVAPGRVVTTVATQVQSQDPKESATLVTEKESSVDLVLPPGTKVTQGDTTITVATNTPIRIYNRETADSKIGAADLSIGKVIAKLESMKWIQVVGIIVMLFGVASLVYPPIRAIIGSVTTSIVIAVAGLGLIVLPILLVGHELLILGGCAAVALGYLFLHRYGKKSGENAILKKWVDANNDGKVNPGELTDIEK